MVDSSPCVRRAAVAFDARREQQPWGEHRCPTVRSRRWSLASRRSVTALRGGMRTTEPFFRGVGRAASNAAVGFIPDDRRTSAHVSDAPLGCFLGWRFWLCRKLKHRRLLPLA
jgi:hypothetical protein